jgi:hypothetical protein
MASSTCEPSPEEITKIIITGVGNAAKKLALNIHGELVDKTPVDTGWARSNWIPQVGRPFEKTVGDPENLSDRAEAGVAEVSNWKISDGPIHITNNVPYIRKLNGGSSAQVPAGFVNKAVQGEVEKIKGKPIQ